MNPLVSILIPTYNREALIGEALDSALAQTYSNIEVIVGDNCSTDATVAIVKQYAEKDPRVKFFQNEKNLGPVLNWKACMERASGEYIKILWSDDLMSSDFIERALSFFREDPSLAFVFSKAMIGESFESATTEHGQHFGKTGVYPVEEFVWGVVGRRRLPFSPGCALFRTDILRKSFVMENDLFQNRYLQNGAGPDLLMFLMACKQASRFAYIEDGLSFFRSHADSISVSSEHQLLRLDYAKAVLWFLYHHVGKRIAQYYWLYWHQAGKKLKSIDEELSSDCLGLKHIRFTDSPFLLRARFMKPKRYLSWLCERFAGTKIGALR